MTGFFLFYSIHLRINTCGTHLRCIVLLVYDRMLLRSIHIISTSRTTGLVPQGDCRDRQLEATSEKMWRLTLAASINCLSSSCFCYIRRDEVLSIPERCSEAPYSEELLNNMIMGDLSPFAVYSLLSCGISIRCSGQGPQNLSGSPGFSTVLDFLSSSYDCMPGRPRGLDVAYRRTEPQMSPGSGFFVSRRMIG